MTIRNLITIATLTTTLLTGQASAETLSPLGAGSVSLGDLSGVAYYTAEPKGYRVVVTLARTETSRAVRFETILASGQSVTLSTPQELGTTADSIEITRSGDTVAVNRPRPEPQREATARD